MTSNQELRELVERVKNGEAEVLDEIYRKTCRSAFFHAQKVLEEQSVKDTVAEAFLRAYQNLDTLSHPELFQAWIDRTVTYVALEMEREDLCLDAPDFEDNGFCYTPAAANADSSNAVLDDRGTEDILGRMIEALPKAQLITVIMHYYDEMSVVAISRAMQCPEDTVKSLLNHAIKNIENAVREEARRGITFSDVSPAIMQSAILRLVRTEEIPRDSAVQVRRMLARDCGYLLPVSDDPSQQTDREEVQVKSGDYKNKVTRPKGGRAEATKAAKAAKTAGSAAAVARTATKTSASAKIIAAVLAVGILAGVGVATIAARHRQNSTSSSSTSIASEPLIHNEANYNRSESSGTLNTVLMSNEEQANTNYHPSEMTEKPLTQDVPGDELKYYQDYVTNHFDKLTFLSSKEYSNVSVDSVRFALYDYNNNGFCELYMLMTFNADVNMLDNERKNVDLYCLKNFEYNEQGGLGNILIGVGLQKNSIEHPNLEKTQNGFCAISSDRNYITLCRVPFDDFTSYHFTAAEGAPEKQWNVSTFLDSDGTIGAYYYEGYEAMLPLHGNEWSAILDHLIRIIGYGPVYEGHDLSMSYDEFLALKSVEDAPKPVPIDPMEIFVAAYEPVFQMCRDYYSGVDSPSVGWTPEDFPFFSYTIPYGQFDMGRYPIDFNADFDSLGYLLQDISGDGIPELIIGNMGSGNEADQYFQDVMYDMFTLQNAYPIRVLASSSRDRFRLCTDNLVLNDGSGGASSQSAILYRLNGRDKEFVSALMMQQPDFYEVSSERQNLWQPEEGDTMLSEAEYQAKQAEMFANVAHLNLTPMP